MFAVKNAKFRYCGLRVFFCRLKKICAGRNFLMGARALGERFNCKKIFAFFFENSGLNVGGKVDFSFEIFI